MYALPDFNNVKYSNSSFKKFGEVDFQYPPPSSSPFLTLGSGFSGKPSTKTPPSNQHPKQNLCANKKPSFTAPRGGKNYFAKYQNKKEFTCDCCNRSFLFRSDLDKHVTQHIKQNCGDMAAMIAKLNTPEEIKKWRDERRKHFPTSANIKRKKEEEAARKARGEVLPRHFCKIRRRHQRKNLRNGTHHRESRKSSIKRHRKRKSRNSINSEFDQTNKSSVYNGKETAIAATEIGITSSLTKFPGTRFIEKSETNMENKDSVLTSDHCLESNEMNHKENTLNNLIISDSEVEEKNNFVISDSEIEDIPAVATCSDLPINPQLVATSNKTIDKTDSSLKAGICETEKHGNRKCDKTNAVVSTEINCLSFFTAGKEIEDSEDELATPSRAVESKKLEDSTQQSTVDSSPQIKVGGVLGSLMLAYNTESETESKDSNEPISGSQKQIPTIKGAFTPTPIKEVEKKHYVSRRNLTLLEKLLASEIRHERNVIFQCINFIVNKNFFDE